jgi:hypothetical protein
MAGRRVQIGWKVEDTPEILRERCRREEEGEVRTHLQARRRLTGWSMEQAAGAGGGPLPHHTMVGRLVPAGRGC